MMLPAASSPRPLLATRVPPPKVNPHAAMSSTRGLTWPWVINGCRFWRTLSAGSAKVGSPCPHTPTEPRPAASVMKVPSPGTTVVRGWPQVTMPPGWSLTLNPALKQASTDGASAGLMVGPESGPMAAEPDGGSRLPMWRSKVTFPARNRTSVMTLPSGSVSDRVSMAIPPLARLTVAHPACSTGVVVVVEAGARWVVARGGAARTVEQEERPSAQAAAITTDPAHWAAGERATRGTPAANHDCRPGRGHVPFPGRLRRRWSCLPGHDLGEPRIELTECVETN